MPVTRCKPFPTPQPTTSPTTSNATASTCTIASLSAFVPTPFIWRNGTPNGVKRRLSTPTPSKWRQPAPRPSKSVMSRPFTSIAPPSLPSLSLCSFSALHGGSIVNSIWGPRRKPSHGLFAVGRGGSATIIRVTHVTK